MKLKIFLATCLMVFSVISYAGTVIVTTSANKSYKDNSLIFVTSDGNEHIVYNEHGKNDPYYRPNQPFYKVNNFEIVQYSLTATSHKTLTKCKKIDIANNETIYINLDVKVGVDGKPDSATCKITG